MKKYLSPIAAAALAVLLAGCAHRPPPNTVAINLVGLNDFHGNLEAGKFSSAGGLFGGQRTVQAGGIDTLGAALQAWRKEDPELLLVGSGDLIGASQSMSAMWADEPTIVAMNLLGLRASSVGNHEFDAGRVELLRQQKGGCASPRADKACKFAADYSGARFSYLAANVIDMVTNKPVLPAYRIEQVRGVKIGLIGAVLRDTVGMVLASGVAGLNFADEADSVNRVLPELRKQGVNVFVLLIHQGGHTVEAFDKAECSQLQGPLLDIIKRLDPAIRLVVSGHSHTGYTCRVGERLVTQADMGGRVLTRIQLQVDTTSNTVQQVTARNVVMTPGQYPADPALDAYLAQVRQRSAAALAQPVAKLALSPVTRSLNEHGESALGDLVADSMLVGARHFGAQIAFMNNHGMRQDLAAGAGLPATAGQAQAVLPYNNDLVVMNLTGAQITALLEQQWGGPKHAARGLLQVSEGFSYSWKRNQPDGSRVVPGSVLLNGVPLDNTSSYRVATNAFLAEGGDAYPLFIQGGSRANTGIRDIDALRNYLRMREQIGKPAGSAAPLGRIQSTY
ncbi:bifunctional metallophosphatase/5'-nucleotidase [Rugamonas rubra]|uniref:5'-nucleotidase n=1 Tax=Rugamonas rubra TaxID=758825 RepID=A0A1I4N680_9BURK|nr:bifunctional metallophosphatase/5'-nucleotidase [Rugamonas rubra]SFM10837.1 5'-nucleotidase [Rugamonas rubra]